MKVKFEHTAWLGICPVYVRFSDEGYDFIMPRTNPFGFKHIVLSVLMDISEFIYDLLRSDGVPLTRIKELEQPIYFDLPDFDQPT
ncbi:hypothetical protein [Psychrobacter pygoscelis]|uniref:hypothetical protein n=1 Tax=Psychrobacter pygoscelis TaxID=2488563 RepID=UPI00103DFC4B|nr:hypothetical protein [Psychrobacter pygoscelis]